MDRHRVAETALQMGVAGAAMSGSDRRFLNSRSIPAMKVAAKALAELRDRGISLVAIALTQSADHVNSFFEMLRTELAFYVGCVNLHEQLAPTRESLHAFPCPWRPKSADYRFAGYTMSAWR